MAKVQKVYTREFKEEAVRLAQTSGKPMTHIARELGISDTRVHQWRKELAQKPFQAVGIKRSFRRKIAGAYRELERVQQERARLKKVVSIFSRESK